MSFATFFGNFIDYLGYFLTKLSSNVPASVSIISNNSKAGLGACVTSSPAMNHDFFGGKSDVNNQTLVGWRKAKVPAP